MAPHPLLVRAAQCIEQARALNDEFTDKSKMPAEVAGRIDRLIGEASKARQQVEREAKMTDLDNFLQAPDYKHDMTAAATCAEDGSLSAAGIEAVYTTEGERKARATKAFFDFVRKGASNMNAEYKADLVEDASGEVLIPADFTGTIVKDLPRRAVIRNLAYVRPTQRNKVDVGSVTIAEAGWGKLETGATAPDGLGAPDKDEIEVHDLNALVKLGRDELDDSDEDLSATISDALTLQFAQQEDDAYASGSGNGQPEGIATSTAITQGIASAVGETVTGDELKSLMFQIPSWAERNAVWIGHKSAELATALLKDDNGNYLWQPRVSESEPATLMGYPWYRVDGLPGMNTTVNGSAANGSDKSVFFGDLRAGYMIADRRRLTVQRLDELYATEGKIGLLFTMRVGGGVIRPNALAAYRL